MEIAESLKSLAVGQKKMSEQEQRKANEILEDFIMAQGGARVAHKKWEDSLERLGEIEEKTQEEDFVKRTKELLKEDDADLKEIRKFARKFQESIGSDFKDKIFEIFDQVFNDIRSRSYEVASPEDWHMKVTIGPYGFGLRRNVQAKPVEYFSQLAKMYERKELIADGVRRELGLNDADRWADMWEKFCEIVPDLSALEEKSVTIELDNTVLLPMSASRYVKKGEEPPKTSSKVQFSPDGEVSLIYDNDTQDYRSNYTIDLDRFRSSDAIVYVQLHPQISSLAKKYKEKVTPTIEKAQNTIQKLEDEFGRQLLLSSV